MNTSLVVSQTQLKASRELAIQKAKEQALAAGASHGRYVGEFVAKATQETVHQAHRAGAAGTQYSVGFAKGFFGAFKAPSAE